MKGACCKNSCLSRFLVITFLHEAVQEFAVHIGVFVLRRFVEHLTPDLLGLQIFTLEGRIKQDYSYELGKERIVA